MQKYVFIILFFGLFHPTFSQINCNAGKNTEYQITNWIETNEVINQISFTVKSSNPTVFFIDSIKINNLNTTVERHYYETKFSTTDLNSNQIDLTIYGTGLSGTDSLTMLTIDDIFIDENRFHSEQIITNIQAISNADNINLNYVRIAKITDLYPNPVDYGNELTIYYVIDIPTDVEVNVVNILGLSIEKFVIQNVAAGKNEIKLSTKNKYFSGVHWIILNTNSGKPRKSFVITN